MGLLVTLNGITGDDVANEVLRDAERERREFLARGIHLVVLSAKQLKEKTRERQGLESLLKTDYERLRFGRVG